MVSIESYYVFRKGFNSICTINGKPIVCLINCGVGPKALRTALLLLGVRHERYNGNWQNQRPALDNPEKERHRVPCPV